MSVTYEWDLESWDGDPDKEPDAEVLDHHHGDKLLDVPLPASKTEKLVLVRTTDDGSRLWAYVDESRMLPRHFSRPEPDGKYYETDVKVPQRFHREIARVMAGRRK